MDFTTAELKTLLKNIYDFTNEVAKKRDVTIDKLKKPSNKSSDNIVFLKDYLNTQKKIIEKVS